MKKDSISEDRKYLIQRAGYLRTRANLSARELSQRMGLSPGYINKFEFGGINIPSEVLLDLIRTCGSTPEEFFYENIEHYQQDKNFIKKFNKLSKENKEIVLKLMDNLKWVSFLLDNFFCWI